MATNNESARDRITAARERATAARERVATARERIKVTAIKGAGWKILEFFAQNTAAWGALFYILFSSIGVTYSWAFYSEFDGVHIFEFFDTSDFLLSAFQITLLHQLKDAAEGGNSLAERRMKSSGRRPLPCQATSATPARSTARLRPCSRSGAPRPWNRTWLQSAPALITLSSGTSASTVLGMV